MILDMTIDGATRRRRSSGWKSPSSRVPYGSKPSSTLRSLSRRLREASLANPSPTLIAHLSISVQGSSVCDRYFSTIYNDAHDSYLTYTHDGQSLLTHLRHLPERHAPSRSNRPISPRPPSRLKYNSLVPIAPRHSTPGPLYTTLPPIQSTLLGLGGTQAGGDGRSYHLEVVQQPIVAAEFGTAVLSRLPLSPPPVVQLIVRDSRGHVIEDDPDLGFFIAHLALYSADGIQELDSAPPAPGRSFPPNRLLYGTIVSSPHFLRNLQNRPGVFFIFPDVSVRRTGRYTLRIRLTRLSEPRFDPTRIVHEGERAAPIAQTTTANFDVVPRAEYVAPAQTRLTEYFLAQGARIM